MEIPMRASILIFALALNLPIAAQAQDAGRLPADANLGSAGQFRNITSTGVTKPPGGAGAPNENRASDSTRKQQAIDRKIETGICIGCN
jgi:hypothetical protein